MFKKTALFSQGGIPNLPSLLRIAENQSFCWVRLGDYCNALVNIVILLSGDYYGDFVFLLFETQNLWFLCLICISTFQVGYDNLVQSGREFVREGCLQKLSRKGYQQRMFFLVSFLSSIFSSCSSWWASYHPLFLLVLLLGELPAIHYFVVFSIIWQFTFFLSKMSCHR